VYLVRFIIKNERYYLRSDPWTETNLQPFRHCTVS